MKLTTSDFKRSIFIDVKKLFSTDLPLYVKNCRATRVEEMTHLIKDNSHIIEECLELKNCRYE